MTDERGPEPGPLGSENPKPGGAEQRPPEQTEPAQKAPEQGSSKETGTNQQGSQDQPWRPSRKGPVIIAVIAGLVIAAILAVLAAWHLPPFDADPITDDAYVRGRTTVIAPQVSGYIAQVLVVDYAHVSAGDLLVVVDDSTYRARAGQAAATLDLRRAQLSNNEQTQASARATITMRLASMAAAIAQRDRTSQDFRRAQALVRDGGVSGRDRDAAEAAFRQATASVAEAEANVEVARQNLRTAEVQRLELSAEVGMARSQLDAANIDLGHTRIFAPDGGQIGQVTSHVGAFVAAGSQLFSLVPPDLWVVASYKEAQTHAMRVGQHASFTVDALNDRRFVGVVEQIAPATNSEFAQVRPEDATGNFVKVPRRIGIRIHVEPRQDGAERLRPGLSVVARVDTAGGLGEPPGSAQ